jgi:plasmid stabilization system protein ParE
MARKNRLKLIWMPQALESVREIQKSEKRSQLRASARLVAAHPEMHRLRRTRSWGFVGLLRVSPFVAVYRVVGQELQILDVLREELLASREIDED